jgi:hypothetical protein
MSHSRRVAVFFAVFSLVLLGHTAHAQGVQTGLITGIVSSQDDAPLPGVTVTAAPPRCRTSVKR